MLVSTILMVYFPWDPVQDKRGEGATEASEFELNRERASMQLIRDFTEKPLTMNS